MSETFSNLLSGLIGSAAGGFLSIGAAWFTVRWTVRHQKRAERETTRNRLSAIHDELEAAWERYNQQIGQMFDLSDPTDPPLITLPVEEDYFPIYRANTDAVAQIKDDEIRRAVARTYVSAVGMIDSLRFNNALTRRLEDLAVQCHQAPSEGLSVAYSEVKQGSQAYWGVLCSHHSELGERIASALFGLQKTIRQMDEAR